MCGLAGIAGSFLSDVEIEAFKDLMAVSCLRGWQGAGVVRVNVRGEAEVMKTTKTAAALVSSQEFADLVKPKTCVLMGHARWPTKGNIDINHTHPHIHDHIVGMHNGTLTRFGDTTDFKEKTDSQYMIESIAKVGIKETLKEATGAYALTWYDTQTKRLSMIRNYERTLFVGELLWQHKNRQCNGLIWASEEGFIKLVCDRRQMPLGKIQALETHSHVSFPVRTNSVKLNAEDCWPFTYTPWKGSTAGEYQWPDHNLDKGTAYGAKSEAETTKTTTTGSSKGSLVAVDGGTGKTKDETDLLYKTKNLWVTRKNLDKSLNAGCAWCGSPSTFQDYIGRRLFYFEDFEFACIDCVKDADCRAYVLMQGVELPPYLH